MIKCFVFNNKGFNKIDFDKINSTKRLKWIKVINPSKEALKQISDKTGVYMQDLLNCLDPEERARLENESNYSLVISKAPVYSASEISTASIGLIITKHYVLTISKEKLTSLDGLEKKLDYSLLSNKGMAYLVFKLLLQINRDFYNLIFR